MEEKKASRNIRKYIILYIIIILLVNTVGAVLPANFLILPAENSSVEAWHAFLLRHEAAINYSNLLNFVVPVVCCLIYINPKNRSDLPGRMINMPFRFAGIGCLGWCFDVLMEIILLLYLKFHLHVKVFMLFLNIILYPFFIAFFCFTINFFILELIHRRFFLPVFFPEGNVKNYKIIRRAPLSLKMVTFYISVSIVPVLYMLISYVNLRRISHVKDSNLIFIVLSIFIFFGFMLLFLTIRYLNAPLKKLKEGAEKITHGKYSHKINFISNDVFGDVTDAFNDMVTAIKKKSERIEAIQDSIIKGMALMVESRDVNTGGHINRTSECIKVFARKLQKHPDYSHIDKKFFDKLIKAAPMHDLGKIAVDDAVLRKPGKYTPEEYEIIKKHSEAGAQIVEQVIHDVEDEEFKQIAINVAHYHHEKWNGEGYPCGLKEEEIPFEARVMALADVFDALVSKRCYKDSLSYNAAFNIIQKSLGTHFDPFLGLQFLECRDELENLYDIYKEEEIQMLKSKIKASKA